MFVVLSRPVGGVTLVPFLYITPLGAWVVLPMSGKNDIGSARCHADIDPKLRCHAVR